MNQNDEILNSLMTFAKENPNLIKVSNLIN